MEPTVTYEKVSEVELKIVKETVVSHEEVVTLTDLEVRRANTVNAIEGLQRQLDEQNALLVEIDGQIAEAKRIGVKEESVVVRDADSGVTLG